MAALALVAAVTATGSVSTGVSAATGSAHKAKVTHQHVVVTDADNMRTVTLRRGDTLTVVLSGGWRIQGSSDPRVLRQQGPATPDPAACAGGGVCPLSTPALICPPNAMCATPAPSPAGQTATFTAKAPGSATISATRAPRCPPGAMCPMYVAIWHVGVTVTR